MGDYDKGIQILAMYLPQFYRTKENDEWWGDGFTDWDSAKNARPLFENHYQPHIPLNNNFYNLMQRETMQWQADLMARYGVDGMCIYHYWFKDGKKILEKPVENLLEWKDIKMPFCFCWANESWIKSWSKLRNANVWLNSDISDEIQDDDGILLDQKYGFEEQWKEHFEYLLPFFKDNRYIRLNNKPVFLIYKSAQIPCLADMMDAWKRLARESGLEGLYIIGAHCDSRAQRIVDAELYHEPAYSRRELIDYKEINGTIRIEYDDIWNIILNSKRKIKTYFGGFTGYDDTPRRGIDGIVIENATPEKFEKYLIELIAKNRASGNEFVFINAWNEWGEGMHLEPDQKYGTAFLEAVASAKSSILSKEDYHDGQTNDPYIEYLKNNVEKFESYLNLLDSWMILRENGISLCRYLEINKICRVVIYGWGIFGRHLLEELSGSSIDIVGIIDRQKSKIHTGYTSFLPSDKLPEFDAMIVSSYYFIEEIKNNYSDKGYRIISIETLINES